MTLPAPNHYKPGQSVTMTARFTSGKLVDPGGVVLTIHAATRADGTTVPDVVVSSPTRDSQGRYFYTYVLPMDSPPGAWVYRWQATGTPPNQNGLGELTFVVDALDF